MTRRGVLSNKVVDFPPSDFQAGLVSVSVRLNGKPALPAFSRDDYILSVKRGDEVEVEVMNSDIIGHIIGIRVEIN